MQTITTLNTENLTQASFVPAVASIIFKCDKVKTPVLDCYALADALYQLADIIEESHFQDIIQDVYEESIFTVTEGDKYHNLALTVSDSFALLIEAGLLTKQGKPSKKLIKLGEKHTKYYPTLASEPIKRRFSSRHVPLVMGAIESLEKTLFNIDVTMLKIAEKVATIVGMKALNSAGKDVDADFVVSERYVLEACRMLVDAGNPATHSEFKPDKRFRLYQAACHGANGQSSDLARSLQNLYGVPTDYDSEKAMVIILDEMADMVKGDVNELYDYAIATGSEQTIINAIEGSCEIAKRIKKPWSFIKACFIVHALKAGKKPYIGMAFGLDAKCSGPQLGALMTGDSEIAAACGFTNKELDDAYIRCLRLLEKNNYFGLNRDTIKKPFMGIFYGQGALAFANPLKYGNQPKQHSPKLLPFILAMNCPVLAKDLATAEALNLDPQMVANANVFHALVEESFGKMQAVRRLFKDAHGKYEPEAGAMVMRTRDDKPMSHFMPSGAKITMNEKIKFNLLGNVQNSQAAPTDLTLNGNTYKAVALKSNVIDINYQQRTGFVNLIQGTDALLGQLIIVNLDEAGAQHIIAVHDCFRVNICDMIDGKLHRAIQLAYSYIFTDLECKWFKVTVEGVDAKDIIGNYFAGVKAVYTEEHENTPCVVYNQFTSRGRRKYPNVNGVPVQTFIDDLENKLSGSGKSYFFAK